MNLVIIGTGYVGLVTGACFAEAGHTVTCLDIDQSKIELLKEGTLPFFEPGLDELVERNSEAKRLLFSSSYEMALKGAEVVFLTVDTPISENGAANLSYIKNATGSIAKHMTNDLLIVTKSTVPVGTTRIVEKCLSDGLENRGSPPYSFDVISNPEFLKEGSAIHDFMHPDRVIIGGEKPVSLNKMRSLYAPFVPEKKLLFMDAASAELTKYAANAMLATRLSFINEIASLAELSGANIDHIRNGIGYDSRIGKDFLAVGPGFGGSCLPKDLRALIAQGKNAGLQMPLAAAVDEVNRHQKEKIGNKILAYFDKAPKTVAILGLSFKPNTDDIRESSSFTLIDQLLKNGYTLRLFDPVAMDKVKAKWQHQKQGVVFCKDAYEASKGADAICLMTEWKPFSLLNLDKLLSLLASPVFFDARNQYLPEEMSEKGFDYISLGRPALIKERSATCA